MNEILLSHVQNNRCPKCGSDIVNFEPDLNEDLAKVSACFECTECVWSVVIEADCVNWKEKER